MRQFLTPALLLCLCALSSCRVFYPDLVFKTDPEFQYDSPDSTDRTDYRLQPGDEIVMSILSNNGYQLVDLIGTAGYTTPITYTIRSNGFARLPLIDSVYIQGMTQSELEHYLVGRYGYYFLNPYVRTGIHNRRAIVYMGRGAGRVVALNNEQMQLTEVIALAGGVTGNKAYKVKVIRGSVKNPKVFLFDLSTLEGLKQSDFIVRNQDIIHVEPSLTLADVNAKVLPVISTLSTILLIYTAINTLGK